MFSQNNNWIKNKQANNTSIAKNINILENLDIFVLIDWKNIKTIDLVLNKIIDTLLDKIGLNYWKVYNNFSISLDIINWFLKKVQEDNEINIIIWVLNKDLFLFSKIWNTSWYMIKDSNSDLVEITNSEEELKSFNYISSWNLNSDDVIILSTNRLFDYLTKSDILGSNNTDSIIDLNKNIISTIKNETDENLEIITIKLDKKIKEDSLLSKYASKFINIERLNEKYDVFYNNIFKNKFIVNSISKIINIKNNISWNKKSNTIIFTSWIIILSIMLFSLIGWILWDSTSTKNITEYKNKLNEAREYVRIANTNIANNDLFNLNINKAEEIISEIRNQEFFLKDIEKMYSDISIIKKQFNWVETFEANSNNIIYSTKTIDWDIVKILENDKKNYIVTNNSIIWPLIHWIDPKEYIFENLNENDKFVDATFVNNDISLITDSSKVVSFSKNWVFKYIDVIWQTTGWEKSSLINAYNWNLYLINEEKNQIFKHKPLSSWYTSWSPYLKSEDSENIWWILNIAIDWWIYILKNDLSLLKLFSYPKYRLESIVLNNLPKNYNNNSNSKTQIVARNDLNYIYILIDNKIWVFQPSSKQYQDVKSLNYIGQIEWESTTIKSIFVNYDWEITVQNENWIYKLEFEISENKIIIR